MPAPPMLASDAARLRARRQRLRRRVMFFVWGVPLLLLAAACYLAFGPKPPPPPKVVPVSPQRAAAATQTIDAVREALTQTAPAPPPSTPAKTPATANPSAPAPTAISASASPAPVRVTHEAAGDELVTMRLSQADLNAYLAGNPKIKAILRKRGIRGISVDLSQPAAITIHASATFRGVSGNAQVDALMTPDPATAIHLNVVEARFGLFPPPVILAAVNQIVKRVMGGSRSPLPLRVTSVKVVGTDLVLTGVRKSLIPAKS